MTGGTVVILGNTGKNFAAGMSGGVAYVYDAEETLAELCNMGMVGFDEITFEDDQLLQELIRKHEQYTGSKIAGTILENWQQAVQVFKKVMPHEYKAVLERKREKINVEV